MGGEADALVVIERNEDETAEWIAVARPIELFATGTLQPPESTTEPLPPLPDGIEEILGYVARMAAAYSSGLKWNREDLLEADMMNRPERWTSVTVELVRLKCRELGMPPKDVDTISEHIERRKDRRCFNVRSSYRNFLFR